MADSTSNSAAKELLLLDRLAQEKRATELAELKARLTKVEAQPSALITSTTVQKPGDAANAQTLKTLITVITTLVLAVLGGIFIFFFKSHRLVVIVLSCVFIALYAAFVMYVTNQAKENNCFKDDVVPILLKGSTILVLFVAIMIALASVLLPLIEPPKKPDGPGGPGGPGPKNQNFGPFPQNGQAPPGMGRRGRNRMRAQGFPQGPQQGPRPQGPPAGYFPGYGY